MKNYTFLYNAGFDRYKTFILESVLQEQNVNSLFSNTRDFTKLLTTATVDQLRYIFYKIKNDIPNTDVSRFIEGCIELTKSQNYNNASTEIINRIRNNYGAYVNPSNTATVSKIYKAFEQEADLNNPPIPLENFGVRTPSSTSTSLSSVSASTTQSTAASSLSAGAPDDTPGSTGGLAGAAGALAAGAASMASGIPSFGAPGTPPAGPAAPTNLNRRGEQLRQNSTYRRDARSGGNAVRPISPQGGPTYYVRLSPGQYRPAVRADMAAKMPLYIKNPNPVGALAKPYVQVADEVARARRASPADQRSIDKEMAARGLQKIGPGGTRKEADGSVRRKSQFGGALGSLSNFMGDVGNTLKKGSR